MIKLKEHQLELAFEALVRTNNVLSDSLGRMIYSNLTDIEKYVANACSKILAHSDKVLDANERYSLFSKSSLVRQQTTVVRLITKLEKINERYANDDQGKGLLKVVEINLPHLKETEQKLANAIKVKGETL